MEAMKVLIDQNRKGARKCISAVVPRGYHGGAASNNSSPIGLIERWRSGGRCDCSGWDLGCPTRVRDNDSCSSLPEAESEDNKSVELKVKVTLNCIPINYIL
jgi:hypothetical protein